MLKSKLLSTSVKLGLDSNNFSFDNRELFNSGDTKLLIDIADEFWLKIKHLEPEVIFGKGIGSYPLLTAIKMRAYMLDGVDLTMLFIRDSRKAYGPFKKLVEGPNPKLVKGKNAIFIDDLMKTGSTFEVAKEAIFEDGFNLNIVGAAVMIDFWLGSRVFAAIGFPFFSIFTRHELGLTRQDKGLPKLLTKRRWKLDKHHEGVDFMPTKSTPVIHDGRLYLGNDNGHQYCYDLSNGDLLWKQESKKPALKGTVSYAQISNGKLYWSSYDGCVRCADAKTGKIHWAVKVDVNLHSSPVLDPAYDRMFLGTEYNKQRLAYGYGDYVCMAMSDGAEIWRTKTKGMIPSSPEILRQRNLVVCGNNDFHLYILDASTGDVVFRIPTMGEVKGKPAVTDDESVIIASTNSGFVYAIDPATGKVLWERKVSSKSQHAYPIIEGDCVYTTTSVGHVVCLNLNNGQVNWLARLRGEIGWSITSTDSCLVVSTMSGYLVTIDKETGKKLTSDHDKDFASFQPVAYCEATKSLVISTSKGIVCYDADL